MKSILLFYILILYGFQSIAQKDAFTGTWNIESNKKNNSYKLSLFISDIHDNVLYPALLKIECDSFIGSYNFLLIKKNSRELLIGRNKFSEEEKPFSIENISLLLSGNFIYTKDQNNSYLSLNRMYPKNYGTKIKDVKTFGEKDRKTAEIITSIFADKDLKFYKINDSAWIDKRAEEIINSPFSGNYYGKTDTLFTDSRDLSLKLSGKNNGVVSATINGKPIFEHIYVKEKKDADELWLEPGLNMLTFYADEFGKKPNSTGKVIVATGKLKTTLDLGSPENTGANFITLPIYYSPSERELSLLPSNNLEDLINTASANTNVYYYPVSTPNISNLKLENSLLRNAVEVGNVAANSGEVLLALWDDAVEDGDSISLNINGSWVVQGMPVMKKPQFISVKLLPGVNKIVMIADNEGSIPPNTSVLEIIDRKYRKAFKISTDYSKNNLINISYKVN